MDFQKYLMGGEGWLIGLGVAAGILILVEAGLRVLFGLRSPLRYIPDEKIGYLLAPNQEVRRFGNQIRINQYSMRTVPIQEKREPSRLRLFLVGDSIANGGWWTDQDETLSALIERHLTAALAQQASTWQAVEVLNASANSWGPRNELAYLQRFGLFESQVVVLLINTDDLFATAPTALQVGRDRNYPDRQPPLALFEVLNRFGRSQPIPGLAEVRAEGGDRVGANLAAIAQIQALVMQANAQLVLAMTPLLREIEAEPRDYEIKARKRLQAFTEAQGFTYLDFLPQFEQHKQPPSLYRDHIHLSSSGNQLVSRTLSQLLQERLKDG